MSADKYKGVVIQRNIGGTSKSAHEAICLEVEGKYYELRRRGANPFMNNEFITWIGQHVSVTGVIRSNVIFVETIELAVTS